MKTLKVISKPSKKDLELSPDQKAALQSIFDWESASMNYKGIVLR
jgi:hypothetical protein